MRSLFIEGIEREMIFLPSIDLALNSNEIREQICAFVELNYDEAKSCLPALRNSENKNRISRMVFGKVRRLKFGLDENTGQAGGIIISRRNGGYWKKAYGFIADYGR